jgi:sterol desaturase/sphingolipid hydroxylase (fatty acid hydroxylase superfamily)
MSQPLDPGIRTAKGEWRPSYPCKYAPLFRWPFKPWAALTQWLLAYPGYLWPWHIIYVAITVATWLYLPPHLEDCRSWHFSWVAVLYGRNLILLWAVTGFWHLILYSLKLQGTERKYDPRWLRTGDRNFLFRSQLADNIFWSCASGVTTWTAYEATYFWAAANGFVPLVSFTAHPVYCGLVLFFTPFWRELHFYWVHRLIHYKPLYKYVHYLHHKNVNPGPWSGLAMHPVEHILYFSVVLIHWIVPSHPVNFLFNAQHTALTPASGHIGFEGPVVKGRIPGGSYFHYLHHRYFECNYGESTLPLDKMFGTFRDGLPEGTGAKLPEEHKLT